MLTHFLQNHEPVRDILMISLKKPSKNSCINDCLKFGKGKQVLRSATIKLEGCYISICNIAQDRRKKTRVNWSLKTFLLIFQHRRKQRLEMG